MAAIQTSDEIQSLLTRLEGQTISILQVLGINSLKSMVPRADAVAGDVINSTRVEDRLLTISTADHQVIFDLQRTGKVVWLDSAAPYVMAPGATRPTVRLILADGQGVDLTEPANTKRIAVTISTQS